MAKCSSHSRKLCSQVASSFRKRYTCGTSAFPRCLFRVHALKYANVNFAFRSGSSPHLLGTGELASCGHSGLQRRHKYHPCCNSRPALLSKKTLVSAAPLSRRWKSTPGSKRTLASSDFAAANFASPFAVTVTSQCFAGCSVNSDLVPVMRSNYGKTDVP